MPSPFKSSVVLKVEGEEIVVESLLIPMWHLIVEYISTRSILLWLCVGAIGALLYPALLLARAKWNFIHQVLVGWSALCNLIPQPSSNRTHERLDESWSRLGEPTCRWPDQCIVWCDRDHRTWELSSRELYLWVMFIYKDVGKETLDPLH
jgi:hypothetical protein